MTKEYEHPHKDCTSILRVVDECKISLFFSYIQIGINESIDLLLTKTADYNTNNTNTVEQMRTPQNQGYIENAYVNYNYLVTSA